MLLAQGKDRDGIVEDLKMEVQTLKSRCDGYEKVIREIGRASCRERVCAIV